MIARGPFSSPPSRPSIPTRLDRKHPPWTTARRFSPVAPIGTRSGQSRRDGLRAPPSQPAVVLQHLHLVAAAGSSAFVKYAAASALQDDPIRSTFLQWKRDASAAGAGPPPTAPAPRLLSFTPEPTYTLGRREKPLSDEQQARLRRSLRVRMLAAGAGAGADAVIDRDFRPEVLTTDRGGLTTYHGPGQLVLWPVLDLKSPLHANYTVRSYARLLEETTRAFLARHFDIDTYLNEDEPGVWAAAARPGPAGGGSGPERKIAAMGIYLRRHVTGLGLAVNVDVPVVGGESVNPWARFVPCGLEGKSVSSIASEQGANWTLDRPANDDIMRGFAELWARELASRLGVDTVETVTSMA